MPVVVVGAKCLPPLEALQVSFSFLSIQSESLGYLKSTLLNFLYFKYSVVYFYKLTSRLLRR